MNNQVPLVAFHAFSTASKTRTLQPKVVEQALSTAIQNPETAATAWTTIGRMKREAGEIQSAAEAARAGHAANRKAPGPIMLALSLLSFVPGEVQPMATDTWLAMHFPICVWAMPEP
jgi:predicted TPR repeat methyltransferase